MTADEFRAFVEGAKWRLAKTYFETFPHEYVLKRDVDPETFERAVMAIEEYGTDRSFFRSTLRYLDVDQRTYWHMGLPYSDDPKERPGLINRAWIDVRRWRAAAAVRGYEGEDLDRLVERWIGKAKASGTWRGE